MTILKNFDGAILDTRGKEDVLVQIGNLSRKPSSVVNAIHSNFIREILGEKITEIPEKKDEKTTQKNIENTAEKSEKAEIIIGKERNIPHRFAQCCQPTFADKKIIGIIGQGAVTIHRFDCAEVDKTELDRRIASRWSTEPENQNLVLTIDIRFRDRKGILMKLTELFYNSDLNITNFFTENLGNNIVRDVFTLETENDDYYLFERLEHKLKFEIPEITEVILVDIR